MIKSVKKQELDGIIVAYLVTYESGAVLSVPVAEGNRHYNEVKTWIDNGGVIGNQYTAEELSKQELQKSLNEAQTLLNDTDFYIIRKFEEDIAIPEDILIARADAKKLLRDNDISYTK